MSDCLLVFAPQFLPISPPAALGYLQPCLERDGIEVHSADLNMDLYDFLLSERTLARLAIQADNSRAGQHDQTLVDCLDSFIKDASEASAKIEAAKRAIKSPAAYRDTTEFGAALANVEQALSLISSMLAPGYLRLGDAALAGNSSPTDILSAASSEVDLIVRFLRYRLGQLLNQWQPRVLAISSAGNLEFAFLVAALARSIDPELFVVLGGSAATALREIVARTPEYFDLVDAVVAFDGEVVLSQLVQAVLTNRGGIPSIPGVIHRNGSELPVVHPPLPIDLDELPLPDYRGLDLEAYLSPGPILSVQLTRGCYWNCCRFCNRPVAITHPAGPRSKSVTQLVREMASLVDSHGAESFYLADDAVPPAKLLELSRELLRKGLRTRWMALTRFEKELADPGVFGLLRTAGCTKLGLGLESAVPRVLNLMSKGLELEVVEKTIDAAHEVELPLHIWTITGFPTETYEEAWQTMEFIEERLDQLDVPGFYFEFSAYMLDYFSEVNRQPEMLGVTEQVEHSRKLFPYHHSFRVDGAEAWPVPPAKLAREFVARIRAQLSAPELVTREFIVGFILGMMVPTDREQSSQEHTQLVS